MWSREHSLDTDVPPDQVWRRWVELDCWPEDDPATRAAHLDGPLLPGTSGKVRPQRGPTSTIRVVRVDPQERFDLETRFPGAVMHFEHQLEARPGGCQFVHRLRFTGPLARVWGGLVGGRIASGFPVVMANIVKHATGGPDPT